MNFINFSNHPSYLWGEKQRRAAEMFGEIIDLPFPAVSPFLSENEIRKMGDVEVERILSLDPEAVLCQGEFSLALYVAECLKRQGIPVFAACSERCVSMDGEVKKSIFQFVRFRKYI